MPSPYARQACAVVFVLSLALRVSAQTYGSSGCRYFKDAEHLAMLALHVANCETGNALQGFHLGENGCGSEKMRFETFCAPSNLADCTTEDTPTVTMPSGPSLLSPLVNFHPDCGSGRAMTEWKLGHSSADSQSQFGVSYKCCTDQDDVTRTSRTLETGCHTLTSVPHLALFEVNCGQDTLLQGFQVKKCDSSTSRIEYTCSVAPTLAPLTEAPPTPAPLTEAPPTSAPLTEAPPTSAPLTEAP
ncbi:hypothetical protein DIPPA_56094, partial [Diplonema papillatum]